MNVSPDRELQEWVQAWHAGEESRTSPEAAYRHVRRRSRVLKIWIGVEAAIAVCAFTLLAVSFISQPDPIDRAAIAVLGAIVFAAIAVSWRTWRGVLRTPVQNTADCLELARERARRFRRAVIAGWGLLTAELVVFVPWIAYRLYWSGPPSADAQRSAWGLLAVVTLAAVGFLVGLDRWARRDEQTLDRIKRDLDLSA